VLRNLERIWLSGVKSVLIYVSIGDYLGYSYFPLTLLAFDNLYLLSREGYYAKKIL
jgi:hypothetical protein